MTQEDEFDPPQPTTSDHTHSVVEVALGAVPVAGGALAKLFSSLVTPPLQRRRNEWMERVAEALQQRGHDFESLSQNDGFIDSVMNASLIAQRTSNEEKLKALRNALLNAAAPTAPTQALQQVFLNLVGDFTEWHIRVLQLFRDPKEWFEESTKSPPGLVSGGLYLVLIAAYPELKDQESFYLLVWRDLYSAQPIDIESPKSGGRRAGMLESITTDLGADFLRYISEPPS